VTTQGSYSRLKTLLVVLAAALFGVVVFGVLIIILLPVFVIFPILHDRRWIWGMAGMAALAAILVGLGGRHAPVASLFVIYAMVTMMIFIGLDRAWSPQKTILLGTLVSIAAAVACLGLFLTGTGRLRVEHPFLLVESLTSSLIRGYEEGVAPYKGIKGAKEQLDWIEENRAVIVRTIAGIAPSLIVSALFFSLFVNFFGVQFWWARSDVSERKISRMDEWRVHDLLAWLVVGALVLVLLPSGSLRVIAWNLFVIMGAIYLTQGIAVFLFLVARMRVGAVGRALVLAAAFFIVYFYPLLIALGLFDTWLDVRKVRQRSP